VLEHKGHDARIAGNVVLLGGTGFLGRQLALVLRERGAAVRVLGSADIELTAQGAAAALADAWGADDALVFLSAITPDRGRGIDAFMANLRMAEAVCAAISASPPRHVVYLSSDAVYPFGDAPISECSAPSAPDLYGAMHWAREVMLGSVARGRLAVLRSTLLYGAGDPHNSYGPNRLRRMACNKGTITLFGAGEETRDHVTATDAAHIVAEVLAHGSTGLLNVASGRSVNYDDLARRIANLFDEPVEVTHTPRQNPVTHRHFDVTALRRAFPEFRFTNLDAGLRIAHEEMLAGRDA